MKKTMHELSIAMRMVEELTRIARENNAKKITIVNLKIGRMSGIVIDSLKFAFDAIKFEYPFISNSEILIEEVPVMYECNNCGDIFESIETLYFPSCPKCNSYNLKLLSGDEMHIKNLEIEV